MLYLAALLLLLSAAQGTFFPNWPRRAADQTYARPVFNCQSESDCMFLGRCSDDQTRCVCEPGFTGSRCHELDLLPSSVNFGFNNVNFPSWGGVVVRSHLNNTKYEMFASYLVNKCDLFSYGTNSAVLRATANKPEGPYTYQEQVLGPFHHGTVVTEDEHHVFLFADGNRDLPLQYVHDCTKQRESKKMTSHRVVSPSVTEGDYAFGKAPHDYITVTTLSKPDFKIVQANQVVLQTNLEAGIMCNKTNPSPVRLKNGRTAMVLRGTYCDKFGKEPRCPPNSFCQHQHLFFALTVENGNPHEFEPESKWNHIKQLASAEDPFLWVDAQGRYHVLAHSKLACGGVRGPREERCILMASSRNGTAWTSASRPAFEGMVEFQDSPNKHLMHLFQRPKILFDEDGTTPLFLLGGVRRSPKSATQTLMIPFNVEKNQRFRKPPVPLDASGIQDTPKPSKRDTPKPSKRDTAQPSKPQEEQYDEDDENLMDEEDGENLMDEGDDEDLMDEEDNLEDEEENLVDEEDIQVDAPNPPSLASPESTDQILAILVLGLTVVPIGFAFSYLCVRGANRMRGYRAVNQSEH
ncbi:hypothetical protein BASA81_001023 [Batrachochytrium salamandrivorans]|nr:hypothetical protein BASA81_001023 [Batrachochytrium salamandrivorans]